MASNDSMPESQTAESARPDQTWVLYLLECERGRWYAGITTDIERRFAQHVAGTGARYTRANKPLRILATKAFGNRSAASIAEAQLKKLPRHLKLGFFSS